MMFRLNKSFALRHKPWMAREGLVIVFLADLPSQGLSVPLTAALARCMRVTHGTCQGCFKSPSPAFVR